MDYFVYSIYSFFEKIEIWFKVSSVPNAIQQKVDVLKRNFQLSQLIYKDFSNMFSKLFACNDNSGGAEESSKVNRSRRKVSNVPYTSQKLFEMCWTLFVSVKGNSSLDKNPDLVSSVNLLLYCIDFIFNNVVHDNRRDLIHPAFPGLPKNFFLPSFDASKESNINVIEKLSDDSMSKSKNTHWNTIIRQFLNEKNFIGDFDNFLAVEHFETNFKKLNDLYETHILSCGQFDERVFLSHPEIGSKFYGKPSVQSNSQSLIPQTPLSGQDLSSQSSSSKLSPISSYKQNVQKLQALYNSQSQPQNSLKELLSTFPDNILDDLHSRLQKMKDTFCTKMMPNGQDRFQIAEALYYRLLENIIHAEMKTHGRFDLFINDNVFNETLIVLCLEIVLFAFSLHKKLTTLLECFNLEAFHFYKLIEVTIRNNKDYFTNDIIKHLKAVEEQCLDSLSWVSGSLLWEKINEHNGRLPSNQEVGETTSSSSSQNNSPNNQSPKSLKLFFRKFYQLAHLRLKDLCKNLQFSNNTDLLRKIWTLFEYAICEHTDLMKDRHLDQILMCCVYVLCKIRVIIVFFYHFL
jgi:retinoblastoma-like protein 1